MLLLHLHCWTAIASGDEPQKINIPKGKKDFMQNFEACLVDDAVMHVECRGAAVSISTRYSCYCTWRSNNTRSSRVCARGPIGQLFH
ncbi:unnamed protein product [Sphagnum balticum]